MGVMDSMTKGMLKALPVEEREALMLRMMPDMVAHVNIVRMMPPIAQGNRRSGYARFVV